MFCSTSWETKMWGKMDWSLQIFWVQWLSHKWCRLKQSRLISADQIVKNTGKKVCPPPPKKNEITFYRGGNVAHTLRCRELPQLWPEDRRIPPTALSRSCGEKNEGKVHPTLKISSLSCYWALKKKSGQLNIPFGQGGESWRVRRQ